MRCVSGIVPTAPSPSGCKRRRVHTGLLFCLPPGWAQNGAQADFFCCHGPKKFRGGDKKRNRLRIYRCGWWSRERSTSACAPQRSEGVPVPTGPRRQAENGGRPSQVPNFSNALRVGRRNPLLTGRRIPRRWIGGTKVA